MYTYQSLYYKVCRFANVLKKHGIKKGDRVAIYMPMIPELAIAMLACARIGAIHSIVFGGFSAQALRDRIQDCEAQDAHHGGRGYPRWSHRAAQGHGRRGAARVPHDRAASSSSRALRRAWTWSRIATTGTTRRSAAADISQHCDIEWMDAEDPLFILYTSGSTGKPKGVLHTTAGYLLYTTLTFKYTFDYHDEDVYWCTADIGWITGHSYIVYGPLALGATSLMFEGVPTYPDAGRFWQVVEKHGVNQFYTAPTAIRALMKAGDEWPAKYDMSSLRVLGTVGEPINPEAWMWYYKVVGKENVPIVDTYWQTETGGHMITNLPGSHAHEARFGHASDVRHPAGHPQRGQDARRRTVRAVVCASSTRGPACFAACGARAAPSATKEVYFSQFPGMYFTGDGARKDEDGYYWLLGRVDDVINVSGHRMGTAEVESALVSHAGCRRGRSRRLPARDQGRGHLRLRHPQEATRGRRGSAQAAHRSRASGDRSDRDARTTSTSCRSCPRRVRARSCAASCARSPPARRT